MDEVRQVLQAQLATLRSCTLEWESAAKQDVQAVDAMVSLSKAMVQIAGTIRYCVKPTNYLPSPEQ